MENIEENTEETITQDISGTKPQLSIKSILSRDTASLRAKVEFQYGIIFHLKFLARETLQKLSRDCTVYKYNPKTRVREPQLDTDKLIDQFCEMAVEGWDGMTPRALSKLLPITFDEYAKDRLDEEIPFSQEQLTTLVAKSSEIDAFLQQTTTDINFFNQDLEHELGNSKASQNGS